MGRKVTVVPPDPAWPARFEEHAARLRGIFADALITIHHVGSTSVPGLWSKPIVDLLPVARSIERIDDFRAAAEAAGYTWRGEHGQPGRRYLRTDEVHVHIFEAGHPAMVRNLAFRDLLRADPAARAAYEANKRELAARFADDRDAYQDGKGELIERLLRAAMGDAYIAP